MLSKAATSACALALLVLVSSAAYAQVPFDKRTTFTFNRTVQLPGVQLPPGEYIFRLADPETSRKVVQVLSANRNEVYAMLHTIPRQRAEAPDKPEISFMETAAGVPPAIQTWWYQGERTGREFMYSREEQARIATAIAPAQPVITYAGNEASEAVVAEATPNESLLGVEGQNNVALDSQSAEANVENPEAIASKPEANVENPEAVASNAEQSSRNREAGAVGTSGTQQASNELPRTAGELPLVGLIGLLALSSGLGLRRLARARM
ncbi:MAG TPA: hypothetical protein VGQ10_11045 [Vicinamibacterales bacterium]|jgi:hypothetical protein|nr:hypothetical protein [Vicinamibacterales bacterium]